MVDQSKLAAQTDAVFKSSRGYAEGGMPEDVDIQRVDPVSGNEVPPGSLPEEVRDDIPAQLSEGEYVVPADVVRYYGVKFFEDLRSDAKMGWDAMDQNGRIGGEPMGPSGMEMGNDELPFDLSELQFDEVDVPEDNVLQAAEGMYVSGYGFGDFVKAIFGGGDKKPKSSSGNKPSSDGSNYYKHEQMSGGSSGGSSKPSVDERYAKAKAEYQERQAAKKNTSKDTWGDASDNKSYQDMAQSMRDTFGVQKPEGPSMMDTLKSYVPDMSNVDWSMGGSPQERAERKKAKGVYGYADGGYAKSEGDPGYETEGALGLGAEGIGLQGGLDMRKYENAAGDIMFIPFVEGVAQIEIPEGYYPFGEVPAELKASTGTTDTAAQQEGSPWAAYSGQFGTGDGSDSGPAVQALNYKELSTEELAQMVKDQQGLKGNLISAGMGIVSPAMGIIVKLALVDQAKRTKAELERRLADPNISKEDKTKLNTILEVANKDKDKLIRRLFTKTKEAIQDVIDPQERVETSQGAPTRGALGLTAEERRMEQAIPTFVPKESPVEAKPVEESLGAPVEAKPVEELPTKETKPEDDIITLDEILVDAEKDSKDYVIDENGIMIPVASSSEKFNKAGQGDSMTPLTDAFGTGNVFTSGPQTPQEKVKEAAAKKPEEDVITAAAIRDKLIQAGFDLGKKQDVANILNKLEQDPLYFMQTILPEVYTPSATVPRVPVPKSKQVEDKKASTDSLVTKPIKPESTPAAAPAPAPAPVTSTSSGSFGPSDWSSVRNEARLKSTRAIVNAINNLASEEEVNDMQAAADRVDSYLEYKETGKPTGTYGFAEGGIVDMQYTGLDAVRDMQKLNQYI